MPQATLQAAE